MPYFVLTGVATAEIGTPAREVVHKVHVFCSIFCAGHSMCDLLGNRERASSLTTMFQSSDISTPAIIFLEQSHFVKLTPVVTLTDKE